MCHSFHLNLTHSTPRSSWSNFWRDLSENSAAPAIDWRFFSKKCLQSQSEMHGIGIFFTIVFINITLWVQPTWLAGRSPYFEWGIHLDRRSMNCGKVHVRGKQHPLETCVRFEKGKLSGTSLRWISLFGRCWTWYLGKLYIATENTSFGPPKWCWKVRESLKHTALNEVEDL